MMTKHLLKKGLLLFSLAALTFLTTEQLFRIYLFGSDSFSISKMNSVHDVGDSGLIKPATHTELIFELKPNLNTYFKLARFKTNSHGLRDKEYTYSKSEDIFRVAVLGDSFTMPAGVEIGEAYHSVLEEKLNREHADSSYQIINFGVSGYNLRQYLALMKLKIQRYDPDVILIGYCPHNDHLIRRSEKFEQRYVVRPETYPFFESFILKAVAKASRLMWEKYQEDERRANNEALLSAEQRAYMADIFSEMKAYSTQNSIPIIIVNLSFVYDEQYADELEALVVDSGLNFADVTPRFKGASLWDYSIYRTDGHPNGKAHRIFAEEIYAYLNLNAENKKKFLYSKE